MSRAYKAFAKTYWRAYFDNHISDNFVHILLERDDLHDFFVPRRPYKSYPWFRVTEEEYQQSVSYSRLAMMDGANRVFLYGVMSDVQKHAEEATRDERFQIKMIHIIEVAKEFQRKHPNTRIYDYVMSLNTSENSDPEGAEGSDMDTRKDLNVLIKMLVKALHQ